VAVNGGLTRIQAVRIISTRPFPNAERLPTYIRLNVRKCCPMIRRPFRFVSIAVALAVMAILAASPIKADNFSTVPTGELISAVVGVWAHIPDDARTAGALGTERTGSGVVIDDAGLVLTIGYLILEADSAEVIGPGGEPMSAVVVGYDHESGFGLLRTSRPLDVRPMELGDSKPLTDGDPVLSVSFVGEPMASAARVVSRRPFAGYWEYLLESAIFTFPPNPQYGGAALIAMDGRLVRIGSLFVGDAAEKDQPLPGNMFVPIEDLKPILADLRDTGRRKDPANPWLGLFASERNGRVFITNTAGGGPAESAGLKAGDVIIGVANKRVGGLEDFFRKVWAQGDAGVSVPLNVVPQGAESLEIRTYAVQSGNRYDWLKLRRSD